MAQRDRRGGMTAAQLLAGGVEQTAFLDSAGNPVVIELYAGAGDRRWRVSFRRTIRGATAGDVTEHATLREARREFRRLVRTRKPKTD